MKYFRKFLKEDVALTKGSQRTMNDKKSVKAIANAVRDDADFHPAAFPKGVSQKFDKSTDEQVAHWFLESLDNIEKKGYEGTVYSRDGANTDWIINSYIRGKSNWEDITGNLNMILRDWYALKNRNALKPEHAQLSKFDSINKLSQIIMMNPEYNAALEGFKDQEKKNAERKLARSVTVVDNDDYRVMVPLNKPASKLIADGAKWCTANAEMKTFFHTYAGRAMLFIMLPYTKNQETGKKTFTPTEVEVRDGPRAGSKIKTIDKFQFDAGSGDFMDIGNINVRPPSLIAEKYPYLYNDIVTGLRTQAPLIKEKMKEWAADELLNKDQETKIKEYDVNKQISMLKVFVDKGYFTTEKRPAEAEEKETENDAALAQTQQTQPPQPPQEPAMESIKKLAKNMLEDITVGHIVQSYKPVNQDGEESPLSLGDENLDEENVDECEELESAKARLAQALSNKSAVAEDDIAPASAAGAQVATGGAGALGSVGGGSSGGQYAPGTAPTMPESIQSKEKTMENVDKDVAAMLNSLKKYDKLNESVLGMVTLSMAKPKVVETEMPSPPDEVEVDKDLLKEKDKNKAKDDEELDESGPKKSEVPAWLRKKEGDAKGKDWKMTGKDVEDEKNASPTTKKGLEDLKAKNDIKEEADPEVLEWMNRFSKLGKMG